MHTEQIWVHLSYYASKLLVLRSIQRKNYWRSKHDKKSTKYNFKIIAAASLVSFANGRHVHWCANFGEGVAIFNWLYLYISTHFPLVISVSALLHIHIPRQIVWIKWAIIACRAATILQGSRNRVNAIIAQNLHCQLDSTILFIVIRISLWPTPNCARWIPDLYWPAKQSRNVSASKTARQPSNQVDAGFKKTIAYR